MKFTKNVKNKAYLWNKFLNDWWHDLKGKQTFGENISGFSKQTAC